jgi:hypothetical protein
MPVGNPASINPTGSATGGAGAPASRGASGNFTSTTTSAISGIVAGTNTTWHTVVLWFLGAVALLALADPAPGIATALVLLIILGTLLNNWSTYKSYLGLK